MRFLLQSCMLLELLSTNQHFLTNQSAELCLSYGIKISITYYLNELYTKY